MSETMSETMKPMTGHARRTFLVGRSLTAMRTATAALGLFLALAACDKASGGAPAPGASAPGASAPMASLPPSNASSAAPTAVASSTTPVASQSWHGAYKSAASTLTVPPDWKKVHWSDTETTAGIGDGTMALTVDSASGHVNGTVDGPLGPATVDGVLADGKLAATLRRKDPADQGFTGTLLGSLAGDHGDGTMNVSLGLASALRSATFHLSPGAAGNAP
jgi:hypothetical protein